MEKYILVVSLFVFTGCAYTTFAPPAVLYSDSDSIGVRYRSSGVVTSAGDAEKAMSIVEQHCLGSYKVANRHEEDGWTTIDAQCE